jgi:hypothetical protein
MKINLLGYTIIIQNVKSLAKHNQPIALLERITSNPIKGLVPHKGFGNLHWIGENHFLRRLRAMGCVLPTV